MGAQQSIKIPEPPADFPFFTITFRITDKLKIVNAGTNAKEITDVVRAAVENDYSGKIQKLSDEYGDISVQISDAPFASLGMSKSEAVNTRLLLCGLLRRLRVRGWQLLASTDLSRQYYTSTWIFQRNTDLVEKGFSASADAASSPPMVCVTLSKIDQLTLVNGSPELFEVLQKCVNGVSKVTAAKQLADKIFNVTIEGKPWQNADFSEGIKARMILLNIFRTFNIMNLAYRGSCNVKDTADCLFFQQNSDDVKPVERQYAIMSLNAKNCLRLINLPSTAVEVIKQCVLKHWPNGLKAEKQHDEVRILFAITFYFLHKIYIYVKNNIHTYFPVVSELQLCGEPWFCEGQEAAAARLLIATILQELLAEGWAVHTALDISRKLNNKGIFVFRSCTPASLPHMALAPEGEGKIRLINAPDDVKQAMDRMLVQQWPPDGIKSEGPSYGGHEWKLALSPWHPDQGHVDSPCGNRYALARNLLAHLLLAFRQLGWLLVCSADVSARYASGDSGSGFRLDVHTLFFVHVGKSSDRKPQTSTVQQSKTEKNKADADLPPPYNQIAF